MENALFDKEWCTSRANVACLISLFLSFLPAAQGQQTEYSRVTVTDVWGLE